MLKVLKKSCGFSFFLKLYSRVIFITFFIMSLSSFSPSSLKKDSLLSWEKELQGLNQSQYKAVSAKPAHTLVSAGAGTGKTRVLSLRFLYLHEHHGVPLEKIMAVTFTNKAAYEMKQRLGSFLPVENLWVGTFHALSIILLKDHGHLIGRPKGFVVVNPGEQQSIMNKILKNNPLGKTITTKSALLRISQWKQALEDPRANNFSPKDFPYLQLYEAYEEQLLLSNALDFDDLILHSTKLLHHYPEVSKTYDFQHILVDEYQDINTMQYQWLQGFSGAFLFCVGDEDQAIYGWRGATVEKILDFSKDFPGSHIITLEKNYRSTESILQCASSLIANNKERYGKVLQSQGDLGEKVRVRGLYDTSEEAAFVAQEIMKAQEKGESLSSMAILTRTGAQTREFEERFMMQHIPYTMVGNTRFYDRLEIRDALSYLRTVYSPQDNLAFERLLGTPKKGIGPGTLKSFYEHVKIKGISLEEGARLTLETLNPSTLLWGSLKNILDSITHWRHEAKSLSPSELMEKILEESGYNAQWEPQGIVGQARLENLREFIKSLERFENLQEALEKISFLSDVQSPEEGPGIQMMTLHGAKGLEFHRVFLPGWEENSFPHIRALEEGEGGLEEERRLAYVGLTRGQHFVTISFSWNRRMSQGGAMPCIPSRFIYELPKSHCVLDLKTPYGQPFSTSQNRHYHLLDHQYGASSSQGSQSFSRPKKSSTSGVLHTIKTIFSPQKTTFSSQKAHDLSDFKAGDKVSHKSFGSGIVQRKEGNMITVVFKSCGEKTILKGFLTKESEKKES